MSHKTVNLSTAFTIARQKWGGNGSGSTPANVAPLVAALPALIAKYDVRSVIDLGCGDVDWIAPVMRELSVRYIGVDVVPDPIAANKLKHPDLEFHHIDGPADVLPEVDLVICRDVLAHLPGSLVLEVIAQARRAAPLLLATSFTKNAMNIDCAAGAYRPLNLQERPVNLPPPLEALPDTQHKTMCLWQLRDRPAKVAASNLGPAIGVSYPPGGAPDVPNLDDMELAGGMGLAGYRITNVGSTAPEAPPAPATASKPPPAREYRIGTPGLSTSSSAPTGHTPAKE